MVTKKSQTKVAQQKQQGDDTARTVNKKACLNATPEKMKRKDGNLSENTTMTRGDIAATEGVEEEVEDAIEIVRKVVRKL